MKITLGSINVIVFTGFLGALPLQRVSAFSIGGGSDYAVLFEGAGGNTMQVTNVTVNGNLGVGNTGKFHLNGPATVGRIDFSAPPPPPVDSPAATAPTCLRARTTTSLP